MSADNLAENLPKDIGVYLVYSGDELLYIGKSINIQKRITEHIKNNPVWVGKADRVDFVLTGTEKRAFKTEEDLIKRLKPRYNVLLRDDKEKPLIEITYSDPYPRVQVARKAARKSNKYFGPFKSKREAEKIIKILARVFPFRSCSGAKPGRTINPCLDFYLETCPAPCVDFISEKNYQALIKKVDLVLSGDTEAVLKGLAEEMNEAVRKENFKKAAKVRDQIKLIRSIEGPIVFKNGDDIDFIVFEKNGVYLNKIRNGRAAGSDSVYFKNKTIDAESVFFQNYYRNRKMPKEVVVAGIKDEELIRSFKENYQTKLTLSPRQEKRDLLMSLIKTAGFKEKKRLIEKRSETNNNLVDLENTLGFKINRIEAFDVSNIKGEGYVSMVVWEDGKIKKNDYRIFKVSQKKPDDYRALKKAFQKRKSRFLKKRDSSFQKKPDLVIIDGGKGQLKAGLLSLDGFIEPERIISIAKKEERVFTSKQELLIQNTPGWKLILQMRDEAHRFALFNNRQSFLKKMTEHPLEKIPGIGPKKAAAIKEAVPDFKSATAEDFEKVPGISAKLAFEIYRSLNRR